MPVEEILLIGFPILILLTLGYSSWRQKKAQAVYEKVQNLQREGHELQRTGLELVRENIRVQVEANKLMQQLIEALRQQR